MDHALYGELGRNTTNSYIDIALIASVTLDDLTHNATGLQTVNTGRCLFVTEAGSGHEGKSSGTTLNHPSC